MLALKSGLFFCFGTQSAMFWHLKLDTFANFQKSLIFYRFETFLLLYGRKTKMQENKLASKFNLHQNKGLPSPYGHYRVPNKVINPYANQKVLISRNKFHSPKHLGSNVEPHHSWTHGQMQPNRPLKWALAAAAATFSNRMSVKIAPKVQLLHPCFLSKLPGFNEMPLSAGQFLFSYFCNCKS